MKTKNGQPPRRLTQRELFLLSTQLMELKDEVLKLGSRAEAAEFLGKAAGIGGLNKEHVRSVERATGLRLFFRNEVTEGRAQSRERLERLEAAVGDLAERLRSSEEGLGVQRK